MSELMHLSEAKGLKFCHLNVRSILNKIDQFRLHFETTGIDVITISETWLSKDISSNFLQLKGYQLIRLDRNPTQNDNGHNPIKRGGGLLTYIRKDLNMTPVYCNADNISTQHCELQRIELSSGVQKNIVIFNVYRPPSGQVETFIDCLSHALESEPNILNKEIIFLGDFNINFSAKKLVDTKKLVAWQNRFGLSQKIQANTRVTKQSGSLIDLIFTNVVDCSASGTINLHVSDHVPVYLIKKKASDNRQRECFRGRSYMGYSKDLLSDELTGEIKNEFRETIDPNACWDLMENFLHSFLDRFCTIKTFCSKENTPAWISNDILTLSKDRDSAWKKA